MTDCKSALSVIGAGSYGTSLAVSVASKGLQVTLWDRKVERVLQMQQKRENSTYLPGIKFPASLKLTSDLKEAVEDALIILLVVPSHTFKGILEKIIPYLSPKHRLAWATKGLERDSGELLSNTAKAVLPFHMSMAALSGPTFARELALGMPTAIAVAGNDDEFTAELCNLMHTISSLMSSPINCPNSFGEISPRPLNRVMSTPLPSFFAVSSRSSSE